MLVYTLFGAGLGRKLHYHQYKQKTFFFSETYTQKDWRIVRHNTHPMHPSTQVPSVNHPRDQATTHTNYKTNEQPKRVPKFEISIQNSHPTSGSVSVPVQPASDDRLRYTANFWRRHFSTESMSGVDSFLALTPVD